MGRRIVPLLLCATVCLGLGALLRFPLREKKGFSVELRKVNFEGEKAEWIDGDLDDGDANDADPEVGSTDGDANDGQTADSPEVDTSVTRNLDDEGRIDELLRESRDFTKCKSGMMQFLLVHVPKTGGTTVQRTLQHACGHPRQCQICACTHGRLIYVAERAERFFTAARYFQPYDRNCVKVVTVLREPVSRLVSAFSETSHMLQTGEFRTCNHFKCIAEQKALIIARNFTLEDAVFWQPRPYYYMNEMARYFVSGASRADMQHPGLEKHFPAMLNRLQNSVDFLLLTDRLEEGFALLSAKFGIAMDEVIYNAKNSSTVPRLPVSPALRKELERQNYADVVLYREGVKLYEAQKSEVLAAIAPRVPAPFECAAKMITERKMLRRVCTRKEQWLN